jgi:hypothetical protein
MWAFPEREVVDEEPRAAVDVIAGELGVTVAGSANALPECEHRFTHLRVVYVPWAVPVEAGARARPHDASLDPARWVSIADASALALPVAQRRVLESWRELAP